MLNNPGEVLKNVVPLVDRSQLCYAIAILIAVPLEFCFQVFIHPASHPVLLQHRKKYKIKEFTAHTDTVFSGRPNGNEHPGVGAIISAGSLPLLCN